MRFVMSDDLRPNFGLAESDARRCAVCKKAAYDSNNAAYCMAGAAAGATPPGAGKRVNENFSCDAFAA
jgi:hypothetical protein